MNWLVKLIKKYPLHVDAGILIIGFTLGANFFLFIKITGLDDVGIVLSNRSSFHWSLPTIVGLVIGHGFAYIEFNILPEIAKQLSLWQLFFAKVGIYTLLITSSVFSVQLVVSLLFNGTPFNEAIDEIKTFIPSGMFLSLYIYLMLTGVALNFFRAMGNRFGHGIIIDYLRGKYREPIEEDRIFMFLDMNGSTTLAEQLGHIKYSRLLNKCFGLLSKLLATYDAEVYQFVGDEAVLTWKQQDLKNGEIPLYLFQAYEKLLFSHEKEFKEKFGVQPTFKASVNAGHVTVTEVGGFKKDLAYHGDVLNTAARILELCKKYKKNILVTNDYIENTGLSINKKHLTTIRLRGKNDEVAIFSF